MKRIIVSYSVIVFLLIAVFAFAEGQNKQGKLQITVDQFNNDQGQALVLLYRQSDELFKTETAFKIINSKIVNGKAAVTFEDLPFGVYGAIAVHDKNSNGKLDRYWFGHPKEPVGFSNNFQMSLHSGKPDFAKLAFTFSEANSALDIHLMK